LDLIKEDIKQVKLTENNVKENQNEDVLLVEESKIGNEAKAVPNSWFKCYPWLNQLKNSGLSCKWCTWLEENKTSPFANSIGGVLIFDSRL